MFCGCFELLVGLICCLLGRFVVFWFALVCLRWVYCCTGGGLLVFCCL